jgi:hypothetical protein
MAAPLTYEASSEQRNSTTLAISSGVPKRPSGTLAVGTDPRTVTFVVDRRDEIVEPLA